MGRKTDKDWINFQELIAKVFQYRYYRSMTQMLYFIIVYKSQLYVSQIADIARGDQKSFFTVDFLQDIEKAKIGPLRIFGDEKIPELEAWPFKACFSSSKRGHFLSLSSIFEGNTDDLNTVSSLHFVFDVNRYFSKVCGIL